MKYSKKDREIAADICAVSASSSGHHGYLECAGALGVGDNLAALNCACEALCAVDDYSDEPGRLWPRWHDALAESMLRTGWEPS